MSTQNILDDNELQVDHGQPQNWRTVRLADVTKEFISGGTPSTKKPELWYGSISWTTSAPIAENDLLLDSAQRFITEQGLYESASHLVPKGNLLVGTRVGVGKAVVNKIDIAISQDLTGVVLDPSLVFCEFVAYQFKTRRVQDFIEGRKRGTTIKGISRFDLQTLDLNVPPLSEQFAIAKVLQTVQKAIQTRRDELALERERKAALMEYLFTHGTCGETTKQTEIGEIPESWSVMNLGRLAKEFISGGTPTTKEPEFWDGTIPWTTSAPINEDSVSLVNAQRYITQTGLQNSASHLVAKDNLLVGTRVGVGKAVVNLMDVAISQDLTGVVLDYTVVNAKFVAYQFKTVRIQLFFDNRKRGSTIQGISRFDLQDLKLCIPPVTEQLEIVEVLSVCDDKITALEQELILLEELFRVLLEDLMTGRLSTLPLIEEGVTHE